MSWPIVIPPSFSTRKVVSASKVLTVNEAKCYTYMHKEDYVYTWTISDFPAFWNKVEPKVTSSTFDVGHSKQIQLQLEFYKRPRDFNGALESTLSLQCLKRHAEFTCKYKISVVKDDKIVFTRSNYHTFPPVTGSRDLFVVPNHEEEKFISSKSTVIFRCELSVFSGSQKNLLNYDTVDRSEVPKLKFDWIFLHKNLSDVMLRTANGKEIPAHRLMLAAASPVFKAMFSHDMLENKRKSVDMVDISHEAAVEMLRYIYTGSVETQEFTLTAQVLAAADKYQLEELKNKCEKILISNFSVKNAMDALSLANKHNLSCLGKKAVDFVRNKINEPIVSEDVGKMILNLAQFLSK